MGTRPTLHVLLALAAVVVSGRVVGRLLATARQPPVIGEVLSGILLGPSLLGRAAPGAETFLFPGSVKPALGLIAQLGVVLYLFLVGLEFDAGILRERTMSLVVTSQASIAVPFALGCGVATLLY